MSILEKILGSLHLNFLNRNNSNSIKNISKIENSTVGSIQQANRINNIIRPSKNPTGPDVAFRMTRSYIAQYPPDKSHFGELETPIAVNHAVSQFEFLDINSHPIGRSTDFQKLTSQSDQLIAYYRIEDRDDEKGFLETIYQQNGIIKAKIVITSGDKFIYTYKAMQGNWKKTKDENHPNLEDSFRLIEKKFIE